MTLPTIDELDVHGKTVILRCDLDVPIEKGKVQEDTRLKLALPSTEKLQEKGATKIVLMGKMGRPKGKVSKKLSTERLLSWFEKNLDDPPHFVKYRKADELESAENEIKTSDAHIFLFENLRFWKEEIENDEEFGKALSEMGEAYVNDAFGISHREHASCVELPKHLPKAAGVQLLREIDNLKKVLTEPKKPVIVLISGAKKDKLNYVEAFKKFADHIYIAGLLPTFFPDDYADSKVTVAKLIQDKEDITIKAIEKIEDAVDTAGTVVLSGPVGHFEDEGHRLGTERVFNAIATSDAFKLAGGGDTTNALQVLGLKEKFDWVSTGGGAMLEYLANGTLPGILALTR